MAKIPPMAVKALEMKYNDSQDVKLLYEELENELKDQYCRSMMQTHGIKPKKSLGQATDLSDRIHQ